jgi:hypothetical protein
MFAELRKKISSVSPRVAITGILIAVVAGSGVAFLLTRGGERVEADDTVQPVAARIDRVDGSVGIARIEDENTDPDFAEATVNAPVTVGDRIYARDGSRASIALTGHNYVRLEPTASLDVLALDDRRTQLALRSGSALFDVGALEQNDFYEVATPCGAVDFVQPGLYQIGIDGDRAIISVLSGLAQVVGQEGSGYINKGQVFTLVSTAATEVVAASLTPTVAGGIVDDYYRYRYPNTYDGRYVSYDSYLSDPFYYDPYRSSVSVRYLNADIPGIYDLDSYGDWSDIDGYGHCWAPRVSAGWAPFRSGYWDLDNLWGPTWVSNESWGWAPYHYGRWSFISSRWYWVPVEVRSRRSYCPAAVAFIPLSNQIGWVPLAPGEVYVPRYYDSNFRPRYLASREVINRVSLQQTFINLNAPSAVTVVPVQSLRRRIDQSVIAQVDPKVIARAKPTIDPFEVSGVRQVATNRDDARQKFKLARGEQEVLNRRVVTSTAPAALPGRTNIAKSLQVEAVSADRKKDKLKIDQTAPPVGARRPDGLPQPPIVTQRTPAENAKGLKQGGRVPPGSTGPPTMEPGGDKRAQQEQLRQQMRDQLKAERQQKAGAAQQQAVQQQQMRQQQKEQQRVQQQQRAEQLKQEQQRQTQMKEQSRVRAQQDAAARQAQQQQMRQQQQQQKQQMRQQQQQQQRQKERKRPPEAQPPQASVQQQQQRANQANQMREQARIQRAQQDTARQQQQAAQRQAVMQQQAARAQAAQRQGVMQQQAARAQAAQRQAVMQQQAARAQAAQRQAAPQPQRPQRYVGPPTKMPSSPQAQPQAERGKRKPPQ